MVTVLDKSTLDKDFTVSPEHIAKRKAQTEKESFIIRKNTTTLHMNKETFKNKVQKINS